MPIERATATDIAAINAIPAGAVSKSEVINFARSHDIAVWEGRATVAKFHADDDPKRATPYEVIESEPNLLLTSGVTILWNRVIGATATAYAVGSAWICIGDSSASASAGQGDMQGTNKFRQPIDTGGATVSSNTVTFVATFGTGSGNFALGWQEMGVANHASNTNTLLNRLVQNFGVKTSSASWVATMSISLS